MGERDGRTATRNRIAQGEPPLVAIVDDDLSVRTSTARLMRSFGYRADAYGSGAELLASPHLARTACVLLDIRMPDMDGLEVQRSLTAGGHRIPVIFISGHASGEEEQRARAVGHFLRKPLDAAALRQLLQTLLSRTTNTE
jgi:FixJ family two-component response regulator